MTTLLLLVLKPFLVKKRNMFILSIVIFFAWHNSALKEKKKDRLIIKWPLTYSLFYACFSFLIQILNSHLLTTIIIFFLNAGMFGKQLLVTCNISRGKKWLVLSVNRLVVIIHPKYWQLRMQYILLVVYFSNWCLKAKSDHSHVYNQHIV